MSEMRAIPGFPEYMATGEGHIVSTKRGGRVLRAQANDRGYLHLSLMRDGKPMQQRVHRLILLAFHGAPPTDRHECRHIDGNQQNNRPENLAWGTHAENGRDTAAHGRLKGSGCGTAKIDEKCVREIRRRRSAGEPLAVLALDFGIGLSQVSHIARRKGWQHVA